MSFSDINNAKYSSHFYLSSCDLINKNVLKNFSNRPRIEKIFLELSTSNFDSLEDSLKESSNSFDIQVESFLVLYLIRLHKPLVFLNNLTSSKKDSNIFSLKIVLSDEEDIYLFLLNLFVENLNELVIKTQDSNNDFQKRISHEDSLELKKTAINISLPVGSFLGIENSFSKSSFDLKLRKLNLKVRFLFKTFGFKDFNLSKEFIKNIPLFWISC